MPAAAVGAVFVKVLGAVGIGVSAASATAVVSAVYTGAVIGAVSGAAVSAIKGDNILEGALKGAVYGGVSAGVLNIAGQATGLIKPVAGIGSSPASKPAFPGASSPATSIPTNTVPQAGLSQFSQANVASAMPQAVVAPPAVTPPPATGLLSKAGSFIENKPNQAMMVGQTLSGAAQGILSSRNADTDLEAAMERDKLQIDSRKIKGLTGIDLASPNPKVTGYKPLPQYRYNPETGGLEKVTNG